MTPKWLFGNIGNFSIFLDKCCFPTEMMTVDCFQWYGGGVFARFGQSGASVCQEGGLQPSHHSVSSHRDSIPFTATNPDLKTWPLYSQNNALSQYICNVANINDIRRVKLLLSLLGKRGDDQNTDWNHTSAILASYEFSSVEHCYILGSHMSCFNQWKHDNSVWGKLNYN